jgi:hypothetical protein
VHVLSDPITDSAFPLSPPARTRNAPASGARTRTSSPGAPPSTRRTPSPTRACRCAGRAPALRYASTHLRFTPPYFPPLTLVPFAAGTGRGRMRFVRQMRPARLGEVQEAREGGWDTRSALQVPLLQQGDQADQEGGTGGLIPHLPPSLPTRPPPRLPTTTRTHRSPATFTPPRHATFTTTRLTITFIHPFCT